ncbi:MAG: hypothetical protein QOE79_2760 [Sphingomonadales bacterium]|jgi:hypothetical protein|nr:hypothetical protein [Sphingomonadales bacterium]MEA3049121.1 hypothetical protein [Sphingomonadales bacterium]
MMGFATALALMIQGSGRIAGPPRLSPAQRDRIARHCHVPRSWLPLREGRLHFAPPATAPYPRVDCVVTALAHNLPPSIFIGNEAP